MRKHILPLFLVCALALVFVAGCSAPATTDTADSAAESDTSATAEEEPEGSAKHFMLVSPYVGHPYWNVVEEGMNAADEEFGVQTDYVGPTEINVDEQMKAIETGIATKVDGIITMALNPEVFTPVINKAVAAGIPVITIDTDAPDSNRNSYLGTDNYSAGIVAGEEMIRITDGKAQIGIVTGAIDAANLIERIDGFKEAIKDYPEMEIIAMEASNSDVLQATQKAQSMLTANPEITAFFGTSGGDILGAAKVVEEKGLVGKIKLVGFETDLPEITDYVKQGKVDSLIMQDPYQMGYGSVKLLIDILGGEKPESVIDSGTYIVNQENIDTYKDEIGK
jgi:ribose transport system substrate-binding protein